MNSLQFGEFTLDRHARELRRLETVLPVSGKAFDLLLYMVENPGRPLSKSELLDAVWPETSVEESNLSQNVFLLRKALGSGADGPIKTLPGRGYQFAAQVAEIETSRQADAYSLPGAARTSVSLEATHTRTVVEKSLEEQLLLPWRPILLVALAAAILLVGGLIRYRHSEKKPPPALPSSSNTSAVRPPRQAVAVLGFRNISRRPEDSWLSTAVAEMLASEMSSGDRLRVIPNEEVARAQSDLALNLGPKTDPVELEKIRSRLRQATGADMLVQGSYVVVSHGTTPALRLMFQVEDANSGKQLASFSETGEVGGLFALVDQAGTELRRYLSNSGSNSDEDHSLSGMSQSSDAMRFYAEGIDQQRRFDSQSARSLFERAVLADPKFAVAHLGLADAWAGLGFMGRAANEAAAAYKLSADLPRAQRLAIEADYRDLSRDNDKAGSDKAINLYKALVTFYPDDETWGLKLATAQMNSGQEKAALETLERLRTLPLTPAEKVDLNGMESISYANVDDAAANDKARALDNEAVSIADKQGGLLLHGRAYRYKCTVFSHIGPVPEGREACEQSKTAAEAVGNLLTVANAVNNLGVLSQQAGNWQEAENEYADAGREYHRIGDFEFEVDEILNLGHLALSHGELEKAIRESIRLSQVTGTSDDYHTAYEGHHYAAFALLAAGRLQEARLEAMQAQQDADLQHPRDYKVYQQARSRDVRGWIEFDAGNLDQAQKLFGEAQLIVQPTHDAGADALFNTDQATVAFERGHVDKTLVNSVRQSIAVISKIQEESDAAIEAEVLLAQLDIQTGDITDASRAIAEARTLDSKGDSLDTHLTFLLGQADVEGAMGNSAAATKILREEISQAETKGYAYFALKGEIGLAWLNEKTLASPQNAGRLVELSHQAERAGFKGLAQRALAQKG